MTIQRDKDGRLPQFDHRHGTDGLDPWMIPGSARRNHWAPELAKWAGSPASAWREWHSCQMDPNTEQLPLADSSSKQEDKSCGCGHHETASSTACGCCAGACTDEGSDQQCSCGCSRRTAVSVGALSIGASSLGALALGALSVGALSIGVLAIRRLKIKQSTFDNVHVKSLTVDRLDIGEWVSNT